MVQTVSENWLQTAWPFCLQTPRCRSSCLLGLGIDESSDSALLSSSITSEYFSSAILISLSFCAGKLCNLAHYSPSKRLGTRHERTGFGTPKLIDHNLKTEICTSQFSVQHRICKSQFSAQTEFVTHNLVHKTEFVDNNLKFACEMAMEFNDQFWRELHAILYFPSFRSLYYLFLSQKLTVTFSVYSLSGDRSTL